MTVLALIPARGGSKGVPRKNLRDVAGHPLLAYSIATGLAVPSIDRVIVSTDDPEIAGVAREYGAEVPFLRPAALAADDTPDLPVFQHALAWLAAEERYTPELVVHLRPTSPFRRADDVERAIALLRAHPSVDCVRGVCVPFQNPYKMWVAGADGCLVPLLTVDGQPEAYNRPRQSLPPVYWQTASIDVTRRSTIVDAASMTGERLMPLFLGEDSWVDIDSELMIEFAGHLIATGRVPIAAPLRRGAA